VRGGLQSGSFFFFCIRRTDLSWAFLVGWKAISWAVCSFFPLRSWAIGQPISRPSGRFPNQQPNAPTATNPTSSSSTSPAPQRPELVGPRSCATALCALLVPPRVTAPAAGLGR
jgi:hypothetical protein